ncbi:MAG: M15 family metallopeptidase [Acutalibacteraceae bacterium]|nr:M15 family metallopeptidase [Acutalibacteraceae bacterium]
MVKKTKKENYILIVGICVLLVSIIAIATVIIVLNPKKTDNNSQSNVSKADSSQADISSYTASVSEEAEVSSVVSSTVSIADLEDVSSEPLKNGELNSDFSNLLLVNGNNPLPEDYDYEGNLTIIDQKYLCGYRNQMDKDAYIFAKAMLDAAWKDNVELYILSPYRSFSTQSALFENEVKTHLNGSTTREQAEIKASAEVARPGTSEHHTGLAVDFNSVETHFEDTEAFLWLKEHGEEYGFIMRYAEDKQDLTGVIYEPWHWRFVGIKHAKEINRLGMCLEEYIEYLKQ